MTPSAPQTRGFTLIEMAVALFVLALLLGSLMVPLTTQVEQRQVTETRRALDEVREALLGHAIAFGYLPCPATGTDGTESVAAGLCSSIGANGIAHGQLPWETLGLANNDVWGNRFSYAVEATFAQRTPASTFTLSTAGDIRVCSTAATCGTSLTSTAVAVVLSHGRNGFGAISAGTGSQNTCTPSHPGSCSADEQENFDADRDFVSRTPTAVDTTLGEFDDIVIWLGRYTLINRMVSAGKLP